MLYRADVDPLKAMKIVRHSDYQTTVDIYTHLDELSTRATAQNMQNVFRQVGSAARKGQYVVKKDILAANVLRFPKAEG